MYSAPKPRYVNDRFRISVIDNLICLELRMPKRGLIKGRSIYRNVYTVTIDSLTKQNIKTQKELLAFVISKWRFSRRILEREKLLAQRLERKMLYKALAGQ